VGVVKPLVNQEPWFIFLCLLISVRVCVRMSVQPSVYLQCLFWVFCQPIAEINRLV